MIACTRPRTALCAHRYNAKKAETVTEMERQQCRLYLCFLISERPRSCGPSLLFENDLLDVDRTMQHMNVDFLTLYRDRAEAVFR